MSAIDANKAYEIGRQGDEQRFRSLIQDALSEGNEAIASWLINKAKAAHEGSFKDIIEEAVENANTESETYKPTDLAKKYWNEYFPEAEQQTINDIVNNNDQAGMQQAINDVLVKEPKEGDHFGEEQAAGLADIFAGLKEGPNDDRW